MFRLAAIITGMVLVLGAFVADVVLILNAASAANMEFWGYILLNKLGIFLLVWNYSPVATIAVILTVIVGVVIINLAIHTDR